MILYGKIKVVILTAKKLMDITNLQFYVYVDYLWRLVREARMESVSQDSNVVK